MNVKQPSGMIYLQLYYHHVGLGQGGDKNWDEQWMGKILYLSSAMHFKALVMK